MADKPKEAAHPKLNLYQKLATITGAIGPIEKTGKNKEQGYAYIEQGQILAQVRSQLAQHNVVIIPSIVGRNQERFQTGSGKTATRTLVNMSYEIIDGDKPDDRLVINWDGGESIAWDDKGTQKALTSNQKYFLAKLFMISDKEDADRDTPDVPAGSPASTTNSAGFVEKVYASQIQKQQIKAYLIGQGVKDENMASVLTMVYSVQDPKNMLAVEADRVIKEMQAKTVEVEA